MRTARRLLAAAGAGLAGLALALPAAAQHGPPQPKPPVGGTYTGPGDTVPTNPNPKPDGPPKPPGYGGPTPGAGGPGGPAGPPGSGGPLPGTPPGGLLPEPPPEPTTPGGRPPVADAAAWELWWHYNRWDHLPSDRARDLLARTSGGAYFLGRGTPTEPPERATATSEQVRTLVRPALHAALVRPERAELAVHALLALARLPETVTVGDVVAGPAGPASFDAVARLGLRDKDGLVAEKALLALGLRGDVRHLATLAAVLADAPEGRDHVLRSRVGPRMRAFAAYGLGLLAEASPDPAVRVEVHRRLLYGLADDRPEVQAAAVAALGLCPLPVPDDAPASGSAATLSPVHATLVPDRADQVRVLAELLADEDLSRLARSQVPFALARLAADAPEPLREAALRACLAQTGRRAKAPREVERGAVVALGRLGRAGGGGLDREVREALRAAAQGSGPDRLTRHLALVALAEASGRPGLDDDPLAGLEETRKLLLQLARRARGQEGAWTALALGVLEEHAPKRGAMPAAASAEVLRKRLEGSRSASEAGALALALGMMRDAEAVPLLRERLRESGSAELRGYVALALGMVGATDALPDLREALAASTGRPDALERTAIGLALLGDLEAASALSDLFLDAGSPEVQAALAAALGWIGDPRPIRRLALHVEDRSASDLSRGWAAFALGRICDDAPRPWVASYAVGANYDVPLVTLVDPTGGTGLLDLP